MCSYFWVQVYFIVLIIFDCIFGVKKCELLNQCKIGRGLDLEGEEDNKMGFYMDVMKKREVNIMYYLKIDIRDFDDVF